MKIDTIKNALAYLKEGEIVYTVAHQQRVYFALENKRIRVQNEHTHCVLRSEEWETLYEGHTFYIYQRSEEGDEINKEKDDEYYSWWHK